MSDNRIQSFPQYEQLLAKQNKAKNKQFILFSILNSLVFLVIGAFLSISVLGDFIGRSSRDDNYKKLMQIYDIVSQEWYFGDGEATNNEFVDRALNAMINEQNDDAYLTYYPADNSPATYGIGISIAYFDGYLLITHVFANSPSSGELYVGDIITKVNQGDIRDLGISEITSMIRGESGSLVNLEIVRNGAIIQKQLTRASYIVPTTQGQIEDNYGILKISGFENDTVSGARTILDGFVDQSIDNVLIDLRDNGGGYIMAFTALADLFTPKDAVFGVYQHKDESNNYTARSESSPRYNFDQIVILINGDTASASESFTAALKDNLDNVTIVGSTSYGKGIAQKTITFSDGSQLRYTYAEYYRKGDVKLHQVGVAPDVSLPEAGSHLILERSFVLNETFEDRIQEYLVARGYGVVTDDYSQVLSTYQSAKTLSVTGSIDSATLVAIMKDYENERNSARLTQLTGAASQFQ